MEHLLKYWWVFLPLLLATTGCSTLATEHLQAEGALASGLCIKGGYAMAGGVVVSAKVNEGFKGTVVVSPDCAVAIQSE